MDALTRLTTSSSLSSLVSLSHQYLPLLNFPVWSTLPLPTQAHLLTHIKPFHALFHDARSIRSPADFTSLYDTHTAPSNILGGYTAFDFLAALRVSILVSQLTRSKTRPAPTLAQQIVCIAVLVLGGDTLLTVLLGAPIHPPALIHDPSILLPFIATHILLSPLRPMIQRLPLGLTDALFVPLDALLRLSTLITLPERLIQALQAGGYTPTLWTFLSIAWIATYAPFVILQTLSLNSPQWSLSPPPELLSPWKAVQNPDVWSPFLLTALYASLTHHPLSVRLPAVVQSMYDRLFAFSGKTTWAAMVSPWKTHWTVDTALTREKALPIIYLVLVFILSVRSIVQFLVSVKYVLFGSHVPRRGSGQVGPSRASAGIKSEPQGKRSVSNSTAKVTGFRAVPTSSSIGLKARAGTSKAA